MTGAASSAQPLSTPEAERKQLTVLFADVSGSMELQERLDPETWATIMGAVVRILSEGIRRFGGTVDTFTGDGVMALFGAPVAQEDHARRACHAAWHLRDAVRAYAAELRTAGDVELQVRLGLNSGDVIVGRVDEELRLDPTALGHTVGLAQRMESLCEPGQAYVSEHTARLVEGWFSLVDLGPMTVKGASSPVRVFTLGPPAGAPPILRGRVFTGTSLVGRARELAALEEAFSAAREGRAQVVGVVGEAGVGKSRLCDEFARSLTGQGVTVRRTTGVSHGRDVPLLPILALLRDYFSVSATDDPEVVREKMTALLVDLDVGLADELPLLFDFLEVPDPDRPAPQLASEARLHRILEALRRVTRRRSDRTVLVLVVEDLHWFDPQSETFLELLIESFPGSRTLVVTNFRPEFSAAWMRHSYYRQLPVAPLPDSAVGELVGQMVGTDRSVSPVAAFVAQRTAGNPFFVEEVIRTLAEDGTLSGEPGRYRLTRPVAETKVPPTVQAVLAARIDRLAAEHKAILQTASVIGRTFSTRVLRPVSGLDPTRLGEALRALCAAELLQQIHHDTDDTEFRFWHPLTQEVAYDGLLASTRTRLHAAVAETVEADDPDRLDERAAEIAGHWERAGRHLEAARWAIRAGNWQLGTDIAGAMHRWENALDIVGRDEQTPAALRLEVEARTRLLQYGARVGSHPDEVDRLTSVGRHCAERLGDPTALALFISEAGTAQAVAGNLRAGCALWTEAARLEQLVDPHLHALLWENQAFALSYTGPLSDALTLIERALDTLAQSPDLPITLRLGMVPAPTRQSLLIRMGRLREAERSIDETIAAGSSNVTPEERIWSLALRSDLAWATGDPGQAHESALEAVRLAEEMANATFGTMARQALALAHLVRGDPKEALAVSEQNLAEARQRRTVMTELEVMVAVARVRLAAGDSRGGEQAADDAVNLAGDRGATTWEAPALVARAQARRMAGTTPAATVLADLDAALSLAQQLAVHGLVPFIHEERGRLRADADRLSEALRLFAVIGATGHVRRLQAELGPTVLPRP